MFSPRSSNADDAHCNRFPALQSSVSRRGRDTHTYSFKHSSRERTLKLSLSALSTGLPKRVKSRLTPLTPSRNLGVYTIALTSPMPGPATSANSKMRSSSPRSAAKAGRIGATDLLPEISRSQTNAPASTLVFCTGYYERTQLLRALNQAGGNRTEPAKLLGMSRQLSIAASPTTASTSPADGTTSLHISHAHRLTLFHPETQSCLRHSAQFATQHRKCSSSLRSAGCQGPGTEDE